MTAKEKFNKYILYSYYYRLAGSCCLRLLVGDYDMYEQTTENQFMCKVPAFKKQLNDNENSCEFKYAESFEKANTFELVAENLLLETWGLNETYSEFLHLITNDPFRLLFDHFYEYHQREENLFMERVGRNHTVETWHRYEEIYDFCYDYRSEYALKFLKRK